MLLLIVLVLSAKILEENKDVKTVSQDFIHFVDNNSYEITAKIDLMSLAIAYPGYIEGFEKEEEGTDICCNGFGK